MVILLISLTLTAAVIGYFGYLIKYKGRLDLIAGYDDGFDGDKKALGEKIGNGTFLIAALTLISGILAFAIPAHTKLVMVTFTISVLCIALTMAVTPNK